MTCSRHSYEKGSTPGSGRLCRRCQTPDNGTGRLDNATSIQGSAQDTVPASYVVTTQLYTAGTVLPSKNGYMQAVLDDGIGPQLASPALETQSTVIELGDGTPWKEGNPKDGGYPSEAAKSETPALVPAHSPLGASGAHRWMPCPGSVTLHEILLLSGDTEEDDPDYRRDGVQAHALGAKCLTDNIDCWEAMGPEFPELTAEMMDAVQTYLDFCRTLPSRVTHIEHRMHRPEFHRLAFGTGDFISVHCVDAVIDFVDYKHGVGVVVEVRDNPQLMYYGYLYIGEDRDEYPDDMTINFHIVQPRAEHSGGPIRSWETRAGSIRQWAKDVLLPAMNRVATDRYLSMGEWCRFCPAKVICPAMACLSDEMVHKVEKHDPAVRVKALDEQALGDWYVKAQLLKMYIKAIEEESERRVLNGLSVPGTKAVNKKAYIVWKDAAPILERFGNDGFVPKTPAQLRDLDKDFVAEWSYNANAGKYALAPATDNRKAVEIASSDQKFGEAARHLAS